jgi:hypothetical protein
MRKHQTALTAHDIVTISFEHLCHYSEVAMGVDLAALDLRSIGLSLSAKNGKFQETATPQPILRIAIGMQHDILYYRLANQHQFSYPGVETGISETREYMHNTYAKDCLPLPVVSIGQSLKAYAFKPEGSIALQQL